MGGRAEPKGVRLAPATVGVGMGASVLNANGMNIVVRTRTAAKRRTATAGGGGGVAAASATGTSVKQNNKAKLPHRMRGNGSYFGRLNVRIYLIYLCCYLLLIMAAAGSNNVVNGLKCYCNPKECDVIRALDCPGKGLMLWDPCQ